ncbi:hypothetical protein LHJ74_05130 [Streptomyces sp. N2-109]|uniref:Ion transporter n=1 Tax=Streptomyces gossypii TaxID=2883101 RepID=A0ABT2JN69_9ACTN|nr:ion channel [Streptomyces gossypii]MCT2589322.1 hypothetical protein [Streptomyces gossypii]
MPIIVATLIRALRGRVRGWRAAVTIALFVFVTSWLAMWLVEPDSNGITEPQNYWWWFLVTGSTVGYGDYFPESGAGHVVGAYVIVGGIGTLTILFTELASHIQAVKGKRMKGVLDLDLSGHIVILGYTPGRTERLVRALQLEARTDLVLCAWEETPEHPMPEEQKVLFVRGDLAAVEVLGRACVDRAATVLIDGRDDNEALTLAVAVDHLQPDVHLVAALRDMSQSRQLRYVNPRVQCVQWHMPDLLTEEVLDPGITEVYMDLMQNTTGSNTYSMRLPASLAGRPFGECQTLFGRDFGATVLAVRHHDSLVVGPSWETPMEPDTVLYYMSGRRIETADLP